VRDGARVLGFPYALGDKIAKAMPPLVMGRERRCEPVSSASRVTRTATWPQPSFREMYEQDPDAKLVIDVAKGLEGLRRQDGIHAAAVVITHEPLTEYLPVQRSRSPAPIRAMPDRHASTRCTVSRISAS